MRHQSTVACAVGLALACGGTHKAPEQGTASTPPGQLEVQPSEVQLRPKALQQFSLTPTTVQVSWSVAEGAGGTISPSGLYAAPAFSGVFHVVATASGNVSAQAAVTVDSGVRIAATSPVNAYACEAVALAATVSGSSDSGIIWSAPSSCGTVTSSGVFTSVRGTGTCLVTAQAHADPSQSAAITVNIAPERVISVAIVPASASLSIGGTQQFAANVTTGCGTFPAGT